MMSEGRYNKARAWIPDQKHKFNEGGEEMAFLPEV